MQADNWRGEQLIRETRGVPNHPYNALFTGLTVTLTQA